jgi:hypothetical protein
MPLKMNIPESAADSPVLRTGIRRIRGRAARLLRAKENEAETRNREAQLQIVMICQSLWVGFWFQFVIGVLYDFPAFYTLSGGLTWLPHHEFFVKSTGSIPFSIAGNFVFYSGIGSAMAVFFGWLFTRGVAGKWRLRFAVALFVTITLGWSIAAYRAEDAAWNEGIQKKIEKVRRDWSSAASDEDGEWRLRQYRLEVERLEGMKKAWKKERD